MSYKEKSALMHIAALVFLLIYIITSSSVWPALDPAATPIKHLWIAIISFILIEIIGHSLLAIRDRKEANEKPDERDKLIEYKASHFSGFLLSFLIIGYMAANMLLGIPILNLVNVLSILVIAEILHYGLQFLFYRRGF